MTSPSSSFRSCSACSGGGGEAGDHGHRVLVGHGVSDSSGGAPLASAVIIRYKTSYPSCQGWDAGGTPRILRAELADRRTVRPVRPPVHADHAILGGDQGRHHAVEGTVITTPATEERQPRPYGAAAPLVEGSAFHRSPSCTGSESFSHRSPENAGRMREERTRAVMHSRNRPAALGSSSRISQVH